MRPSTTALPPRLGRARGSAGRWGFLLPASARPASYTASGESGRDRLAVGRVVWRGRSVCFRFPGGAGRLCRTFGARGPGMGKRRRPSAPLRRVRKSRREGTQDGCGPGSGRGGSTWPGPPPLSCPDRRGSGSGVRGLLPCLPWIRVQTVRARPGKSLAWSSAFLATPWVSGEMRFHSASSNLDFSPWSSPANFVRCCFLS